MSGEIERTGFVQVEKGSTKERDPSVFFSVCKGCCRGEGYKLFSQLLWIGLHLKHGKFGLNIKKSFLVISLSNQGIGLCG